MSLASARPDFGRMAERYDELRPADEAWQLAVDALVRRGVTEPVPLEEGVR